MSNSYTKVVVTSHGEPEVIKCVKTPFKKLEKNQVRVRHKASSINFIDLYHRNGTYPLDLPHSLGIDAAGIVEETAPGVTQFRSGDRVAYVSTEPVGYSEYATIDSSLLTKVPDNIGLNTIAAAYMKGLTILSLFECTVPIPENSFVLFTAASGGVGSLACQYARSKNINLIGTASSDEKCKHIISHGAHTAINYKKENVRERIKEITMNKGVAVIMDSFGAATFDEYLKLTHPLGTFISFGNSTGPIPPIDIKILADYGSIKLTRATVFNYIKKPQQYQQMSQTLLDLLSSQSLIPTINNTYTLQNVQQAHKDIESRNNMGNSIIEHI